MHAASVPAMNVLYTAMATAEGGREGRVSSSDGNLDIQLSLPKGFGGPETAGTTNPEQLFAAGYAACFHSALKLVAGQQQVDASHSTVTGVVGIGPNEQGGFELTVELEVNMPGVDHETAEAVAARAHEVCPYSNATRGNIPVELTVTELG
ncbi:MAG: OsmC family protein [Acidimicrobiales bacterium]|nr:OsmC family protein [Acidimicrobiales bacterium]